MHMINVSLLYILSTYAFECINRQTKKILYKKCSQMHVAMCQKAEYYRSDASTDLI